MERNVTLKELKIGRALYSQPNLLECICSDINKNNMYEV